ncbi:MAG: YceI family protein [Alphaproteobacteria bacterium]|nr:YceI family protein [Alphaproteobacteria bacterium]
MKSARLLPSLFFALFLSPAYAAPTPVAFQIIPKESTLRFEAKQGTAVIAGEFASFSAHIAFHPEALPASKAEVIIDTGSVTASDDEAKDMLPKADWLDVKAFPQATFSTQSFTALGGKNYEAHGTLTMKGVTIPVVLVFTLDEFSPEAASITGEAMLKRKDFRIGWDDTASVADEVKVLVKLKTVAAAAKKP